MRRRHCCHLASRHHWSVDAVTRHSQVRSTAAAVAAVACHRRRDPPRWAMRVDDASVDQRDRLRLRMCALCDSCVMVWRRVSVDLVDGGWCDRCDHRRSQTADRSRSRSGHLDQARRMDCAGRRRRVEARATVRVCDGGRMVWCHAASSPLDGRLRGDRRVVAGARRVRRRSLA
jgi:hypothetical protein